MSILDINQTSKKWKNIKIIVVYLAISIFCIAVNKIYVAYGHGVSSNAMTWMFWYPFVGGILFSFLRGNMNSRINKSSGYRAFYKIYNSGIATLTVGSFLEGIMDIAGTSSKYVVIYYQIGWFCIAFSLILRLIQKIIKSHDIA